MSNPTAALTIKNPAKKTISLKIDGKIVAKRVVGFARQYTQALILIGSGGRVFFESCTAVRGSLNTRAHEINASPVNWAGVSCRALVLDIDGLTITLCPLVHAEATAAAAIDAATPAAVAKRAQRAAQDARSVVERAARIAAEAAEIAAEPARVSAMIDIAYTTRDDAQRAAYATRDAAFDAARQTFNAAMLASGDAFRAAFAAACAVRDAAEAANAAETPASAERDAEEAERLATDAEDAGSPDALALRLAAIAAASRSARVAEAHAAYAAEPADCEPDR